MIDLTNEPETPPQRTHARPSESRTLSTSRPPRFGRNILADVVDLEDEPDDDPGEGPSSSPEVQFVRATTRPRAQPPPRGQWDPVAMISSTLARGFRTRQDAEDRRMLSSVSLLHSRRVPPLHRLPTDHMIFSGDGSALNGFGPGFLDYGHSSFEMRPPTPPEPRPQRQIYKAPSPAPEGFTRTLGEDDIAVCPNCEWELGTGEGKRQEIWVSKPCGHVSYRLVPDTKCLMLTLHRYIAASVQKTGLCQRQKRPKLPRRQSPLPNARLMAVENLSVHQRLWSTSTCDIVQGLEQYPLA